MLYTATGRQASLWVPWHLLSQLDLAHLLLQEVLEDPVHHVHLGYHFHPVTKKHVICCQVHNCQFINVTVEMMLYYLP